MTRQDIDIEFIRFRFSLEDDPSGGVSKGFGRMIPTSNPRGLKGLIEHDIPILARLRSIVGDRSVSEALDETKIQFAENRILGIRAELDHSLKLQVAQAIEIDADHIVLGDHLFYQAGRETVGTVLKSEEFTKLQVAADKQIGELRKTITERGALRDLVNGTLSELRMEAL